MRGGLGMRAAAAGLVPVALVLAAACLRGALQQPPGAAGPRRPFFERLRRLEAQLLQFQEMTLARLQGVAESGNLSHSLHTRMEQLRQRQEGLELGANGSRAATQEELRRLQTWVRKLERKGQKRVRALEEAWQEAQQQQERRLSNLSRELESQREELRGVALGQQGLRKGLESLQEALQSQGSQLGSVQRRLKGLKQEEAPPGPRTAAHRSSPALKKLRAKHPQPGGRPEAPAQNRAAPQRGQVAPGPASLPPQQSLEQELPGPAKPPRTEEKPTKGPRKPGRRCSVDTVLVFPDASTENFAAFQPSLQTSLLELSLCSWVRTSARYLGTILSYATEENDNKLVLHGRDAAPRNVIHFVIGDPAFRELPVGALLDGRWHHICLIWSSLQGRYWFYLDRRLASMGSNFRKGYEIPPGGSLLLGQEQDTLGGGFESSESFVGLLAGFAMWGRALLPGEVSHAALGEGLPRGAMLTLANVSVLNGSVQVVNCTCLEDCL